MPSRERAPRFYDLTFSLSRHMSTHYTRSPYYFLWAVVGDRLSRAGRAPILDIGCGAGQMACLLRDKGISGYLGIDFSRARIERARSVCPQFDFVWADIFDSDLLESYSYHAILALEFLEHVEEDLQLIERIRSGTRVLASVPNFPSFAHVRHFSGISHVSSRYQRYFATLSIDSFPAGQEEKVYFLLDGVRS
jgi:2-polyprenyl-3-methyl-5-hydroxy-6-metoxy-1,4-benzoquinol methylase